MRCSRPEILLTSTAAGVAAPLAFAPWGWHALLPFLLAVPLGWTLVRRMATDGFLAGLGFGLGLFGTGLVWVRNAFDAYGGSDPWIANGLTLLLILALALMPALALALAGRLLHHRSPGLSDGLLVAGAWLLGEWLRSHVGGGFPWLLAGLSQTDGPLAPLLPLGGVPLASLAIAWTASLPGLAFAGTANWKPAAGLTLLGWMLLAVMPPVHWTHPRGAPVPVALVQPNLAQAYKWDPARQLDILDDAMEAIESRLGARLIVLPETALPEYQSNLEEMLEAIDMEARAAGSSVLLGIPWHAGGRTFHNAALLLGRDRGHYFKRRLVPLGEYTPWSHIRPDIPNPLKRRLPDFVPGPEEAPPLPFEPETNLSVSICFEDAFPELWRREAARASLLVNLSNDGGFASPIASAQHLQISRARAMEQQKPLLRATNTGISAIIRPDGSLAARLDAGRGIVTGEVAGRHGATPYARTGPVLAWLIPLPGVLALVGWRKRGTAIATTTSTT